jgi:hypothetical protein
LFLNNHSAQFSVAPCAAIWGYASVKSRRPRDANNYAPWIGFNPEVIESQIGHFSASDFEQELSNRPFLAVATCPKGLFP